MGDNDDYNNNYNQGWVNGPTPSNGNALDAWSAGFLARNMYEQSRAAQEAAHQPVNFTNDTFTSAPPVYDPGTYGGYQPSYGGGYSGPRSGGGNVLLVLAMVGWLGTTSGFLSAAGLIVGSLGGAFIAALLIWPVSRLLAPLPISIGKAYSGSLTAICLYVATTYGLAHYGGPMLNPADARLERWLEGSGSWLPVHLPPQAVSFIVLTQIPALFIASAVFRWRLRASLRGGRGFLIAGLFGTVIALLLGFGFVALVDLAIQQHLVPMPRSDAAPIHSRLQN